ncbi:unnamed protein product, partial [Staurois parvus]
MVSLPLPTTLVLPGRSANHLATVLPRYIMLTSLQHPIIPWNLFYSF